MIEQILEKTEEGIVVIFMRDPISKTLKVRIQKKAKDGQIIAQDFRVDPDMLKASPKDLEATIAFGLDILNLDVNPDLDS